MQPIAPSEILASRNLSPQITRHRQAFENDGFVVLPRFFDDATIAEVLACIEQVKHDRPMDVVVDDLATGARSVLGLLSPRQVAAARPSTSRSGPENRWCSTIIRNRTLAAAKTR